MYVRNVGGYNFAFKYRNTVIHIPCDGKIYSIPDDSGTYKELRVVRPMHIHKKEVIYINKTGEIASPNISGHKRRGRPSNEERLREKEKRISKRIKSNNNDITIFEGEEITPQPKPTPKNCDYIVNIDVDGVMKEIQLRPAKKGRKRRKVVNNEHNKPENS